MSSRITWTAEADRQLFLAIIAAHQITVNNENVAKVLSDRGMPCTAYAVSHRLAKLKDMNKAGGESNDGKGETKAKGGKKRAATDAAGGAEKKGRKNGGGKASGKTTPEAQDEADTMEPVKNEESE